ncbi:MAG TPA: TolC family protein [Bacteroidota bacterium]|nr:TolC family protein [Bacteroidota bacterium]
MMVLILMPAALLAQMPQQLTLDGAIQIGLERSKLLSVSRAKVDAASARSGEAHAGLLPSLSVSGGYSRLSDVPPFEIPAGEFGNPQPIVISPVVLDNYASRVTLQQPLFTGFKLHSNAAAAEYLAKAGESDYKNDESDVLLNITSAYWSLYQALETKKLSDENVTRLQTYHKDTENLMKAGLSTRNDLLKIEVQLSNAQLTQIDAANDVQVAMMNLNNAIGQPIETQIQPASVPGDTTMINDIAQYSNLLAQAFSARPDMQAMQSRLEASKASVTAAQGNYFPQIFLTGDYYYNRPNARYQPTLDEFKSTWDIGVQVQFDLWNWGATSSQVDQARAALSENQILYEQMKDNVSLEVRRNLLAIRRAKEKIAVAKVGVDEAEESVRTTGDKYRSGLATSTELLDADVALLQAKINYTGALVEQELARATLKKSLGERLSGTDSPR